MAEFRNMCLYCEAFINLFKLCCWHTPDAPKIACIGQLPAPFVHSRGHQNWILNTVYSSFRRFNFVNFCHQSMRNAILLLELPCLWHFWPHLMRSSVLCVNVSGAHQSNPHTHLIASALGKSSRNPSFRLISAPGALADQKFSPTKFLELGVQLLKIHMRLFCRYNLMLLP